MKAIHRRMNRTRFALLATLPWALLLGCGKSANEEAPLVAVQAAAAQKSDISRVVSAEAVVFPIAQSIITPKINAPVKKFLVNRGQNAHQRQLLSHLAYPDLSPPPTHHTTP